MKICKALDRNRIFYRKIFMPITASRSKCRNFGMMFPNNIWFEWGPSIPFQRFMMRYDANRKRHMKNKWKKFFTHPSSAYNLSYMWWNGGEE